MNFDKLKKNESNTLLGCPGNKKNEYNKYLKDIILNNINKNNIFVEPFTGSSIISYNLYMTNDIKCHINDIDHFRIEFYKKCKDLNYMNEINKQLLNIKNQEDYDKLVDKKKINSEYQSYIFSRLYHSYRYGLYDPDKKIKLLNLNWNKFLNNCIDITNQDWKIIMEKYKDDNNAFIYLDPPYLNSFNSFYINYDNNKKDKKDNTIIYIDILNYLKICKCKILMSINKNGITSYLYKDFIKDSYNYSYNFTHKSKELNYKNKDDILIITNFV
jgi:site-specific DNA-adenine methylase